MCQGAFLAANLSEAFRNQDHRETARILFVVQSDRGLCFAKQPDTCRD